MRVFKVLFIYPPPQKNIFLKIITVSLESNKGENVHYNLFFF